MEYQSLTPRYWVTEALVGGVVGRRAVTAVCSVEFEVLSSARPRVEVLNCPC